MSSIRPLFQSLVFAVLLLLHAQAGIRSAGSNIRGNIRKQQPERRRIQITGQVVEEQPTGEVQLPRHDPDIMRIQSTWTGHPENKSVEWKRPGKVFLIHFC